MTTSDVPVKVRITAAPASWAARLGYPQTGGRFFPQALGTQCGRWCERPPGTWASSGSLGLWQTGDHILSEALNLRLYLLPWHHRAPVQVTASRKCRGKPVPPWGQNHTRPHVGTWVGRKSKREGVYVCVRLTLCSTVETNATLESNYTAIKVHFKNCPNILHSSRVLPSTPVSCDPLSIKLLFSASA